MHKKRILIFIDWYLPGYKAGGPIRSVANMLAQLSGSYEFWLVTRNTDYLETEEYKNIVSNEWLQISVNQNVIYLSKDEITAKNIKQIITKKQFDTVYINGIYSFYFSILPLFFANKEGVNKIIVAPRGMLSPNSVKIKRIRKKLFLFAARITGFYRKTIFHISTEQEAKDVAKLKLRQKQNFVAMNLPDRKKTHLTNNAKKSSGELRLVSIARISPEKNTLYAIECLSNFQYRGNIIFDLYGSIYDDNYWQMCKKIIDKLPDNIKISHKGSINNNLINSILPKYHFLFLPSLGENFGHSIVESLSNAVPVIISDKTPWRNLENTQAGWDINLDKMQDCAKIIQLALDIDNQLYNKMQEKAVEYINSKIKIAEILPLYKELLG